MLIFFATIGAGAGDLSALLSNLWILAFIAIQLSVHMAVVLAVGSAARLPMEVSDETSCESDQGRHGATENGP